MSNGYIKIHRKILEWEWYDDINTKVLFFHILLTVNYKPKKWHGMTIHPGQRATSLNKLSEETGLSVQQVRTALDKLKSTNELTIKSTNKYTLIIVENWALYQCDDSDDNTVNNKQTTNKQQTNNKQITTTKEREERKKEKNIYIAHGAYGWIRLTDIEYNRLVEEFGEPEIKSYIKNIDEYVQGNGNKNKYKDWNLVIRKAIRDKWFNKPEKKREREVIWIP